MRRRNWTVFLKAGVSALALALGAGAMAHAATPPASEFTFDTAASTPRQTMRTAVAGETVRAGPAEIVEILFSDGSSLVVSPGASVVIETYAYDPATGAGALKLRLVSGAVRVTGGRLNRTTPIEIAVGPANASLADGAAIVESLLDGGVRATLVLGRELTLTTAAGSRRLLRPGFETSAAPSTAPGAPSRQSQASIDADIARFGIKAGGTATTIMLAEADVVAEGADRDTDTEEFAREGAQDGASGGRINGVGGAGSSGIDLGAAGGQGLSLFTLTGSANGLVQSQIINRARQGVGIAQTLPGDGETSIFFNDSISPRPQLPMDYRDPGQTTNRAVFAGLDFLETKGFVPEPIVQAGSSQDINTFAPIPGSRELSYAFINTTTDFSADLDSLVAGALLFDFGCNSSSATCSLDFSSSSFLTSEKKGFLESIGVREGASAEDQFKLLRDELERQYRLYLQTATNSSDLLLVRSPVFGTVPIIGAGLPTGFLAPFNQAVSLTFDPRNQGVRAGSTARVFSAPNRVLNPDVPNFVDTPAAYLQSGFFYEGAPLPQNRRRALDNFVFVQTEGNGDNLSSFIFANGEVSPTRVQDNNIDVFALTRGLTETDFAANGRPFAGGAIGADRGYRGFAPTDAGAVYGTPLFIANAPTGGANQTAVFQADLGASPAGFSTLSVTLGSVTYGVTASGTSSERTVPDFTAQMHGAQRAAANEAPLLLATSVFNTSYGGGAWEARPGFASYFVLENFDDDPATDSGGTLTPFTTGMPGDDRFGLLRLASGVESRPDSTTTAGAMKGFLAGAIETCDATTCTAPQIGIVDTGRDVNNFTLTLNPDTNRVAASVKLFDAAFMPLPTLTLGGLTDGSAPSAFIDRTAYAARTASGAEGVSTLVAGAALVEGLRPIAGTTTIGSRPDGAYQFAEWGLFLSERRVGDQRQVVHMAAWAAGAPFANADVALRGTASYKGHALGTVFERGASGSFDQRLSVGAFTQSWDFAARTASMTLAFDNTNYAGNLQMGAGATYLGGIANSGASRVGVIDGLLVGEQGGLPGGTVGQFEILSTDGAYGAAGAFAGDRGP